MSTDHGLSAAELEALDPHPDVHALFHYYNQLYFENCLGACSVEWSTKRMTLCAGVCHYQRGGGCRIKLSEPLLKYRPLKDLKETLLHEMIHAELFLKGVRDDGDHGPKFRARMEAINKAVVPDYQRPGAGYNITVYHTMHDEVNIYRTHVWSCNRCGNTVKRSMNRPPQEADCRAYSKAAAASAAAAGTPGSYCSDARCWYHAHVKHCGGQYVKISEPEKQQSAAGSKASSSDKSVSGSRKRFKQPAAAAAGIKPIEVFFKADKKPQQQQQQQQMQPQDTQHAQQHQQQPAVKQQERHPQQPGQQQPQNESVQTYWQTLGNGRLLGGDSKASPSMQAVPATAIMTAGTPSQRQYSLQAQQLRQRRQKEDTTQQQLSQLSLSTQQQLQPPMQEQQAMHDIVELLSDEDEDQAAAAAAAPSSRQIHHATASAMVAEADFNHGGICVVSCPVCCQEWLPGVISNAELNAHLDQCLTRMRI